jgi:putative phosphoesterase
MDPFSMIVVLGDTHREAGHGLTGHIRGAVEEADIVLHTGDFTTQPVLLDFRYISEAFYAVYGNNDAAAVRDRLPAREVVERSSLRLVMVHGHEHTETAVSFLAREVDADLVILGHSHRPRYTTTETASILNPGSHCQPRAYRPGYAELHPRENRGILLEPDGTQIESFSLKGSLS